MARQRDDRTGAWSTLTHARIRAAQGDLAGARGILEAVLARTPDDEQARRMMHGLDAGQAMPSVREIDETVPPRRPGDARRLAGEFRRNLGRQGAGGARRRRIARLERWLKVVGRPGPGARPDDA